MNKIIRATWRKNAEWGERLLPTVYTNEDLIPRFKELDADVEELRKTVKVHEQLQILANYCRAFEIEKVDITYERDEVLSPDEVRVAQFFETNPAFKSFRNPHADLTKKGCFEVAKEEGWDDLLKLTSFCRRPKKKGIPCGMCGPCCDAVKEGMGFRLPFVPRMKAKMIIPFRNYYRKNYLKHNKGIFKIAKRKLEHKL
ncbi:MAG: hypothetical protein U9R49_12735, partial [Bacteroidota bacterium]|nr:hypothetical protein [Bacteroidota bacterium]